MLPRDRELHGAEQPVHVWQDEQGKTESRGKKVEVISAAQVAAAPLLLQPLEIFFLL